VLVLRRSSSRIRCITALIGDKWENACGKFPRWRPVCGSISSAYSKSGLAKDSSFSHSARGAGHVADLGQQAARNERQCLRGGLIEPLRIID